MEKEHRVQKFIDAVEKEFGVLMVNVEKIERSVYGVPTSDGLKGGLGEEATPAQVLAKYDQYLGAIFKGAFKVKNGTFNEKGLPVKKPVVLLVRMNGEYVEHQEGEKESVEMQVAKKQAKGTKKPTYKKIAK